VVPRLLLQLTQNGSLNVLAGLIPHVVAQPNLAAAHFGIALTLASVAPSDTDASPSES